VGAPATPEVTAPTAVCERERKRRKLRMIALAKEKRKKEIYLDDCVRREREHKEENFG
jgi:hypothetical protein